LMPWQMQTIIFGERGRVFRTVTRNVAQIRTIRICFR
jgi:hypothetical protein